VKNVDQDVIPTGIIYQKRKQKKPNALMRCKIQKDNFNMKKKKFG